MRKLSGKHLGERDEAGADAFGGETRPEAGVACKQEQVEDETANGEHKFSSVTSRLRRNLVDEEETNTLVKGRTLRGLPYGERVRAYMSARNRIFGERQCEGMTLATKRVIKAGARFRPRRITRRQIVETVRRVENTDPRVFVDVVIGGQVFKGLLDSGACVSLMGRGCRELVSKMNWNVQPYASKVTTAAGASRPILG
ncbi:uncharacterized protein LOC133850450 [Drosophila sulfurigaster albostrigata]|uniref:uncharacterized protein LOC133850450 n=1 Tax=Drosophila sulfurigaster albostrigata TaxID=89887 RepID=UPI002D218697|nr:uncharacterized protein LOC133850450 [Drosophila sulfurigaster albostrigata]